MTALEAEDRPAERCRLYVRGTVQGVEFRPFVWRHRRAVAGFVRNTADGVVVEIDVHANPSVPANDGAISLGQALVAASRADPRQGPAGFMI